MSPDKPKPNHLKDGNHNHKRVTPVFQEPPFGFTFGWFSDICFVHIKVYLNHHGKEEIDEETGNYYLPSLFNETKIGQWLQQVILRSSIPMIQKGGSGRFH